MNLLLKFKDTKKPIIIFGAIAVFPFFILAFFNHPFGDDFTLHFISMKFGFLRAQEFWYLNQHGRYFSLAILSFKYLLDSSFIVYKILPLILISTFIISVYYLIKCLFKNISKNENIYITSFFIIIYLYNLPSITEAFYWSAGSISYQLANNLFLFFLGILIKLLTSHKRKYLVLAVILSFMIIGSNEISMITLDFLLISILLYVFLRQKKVETNILILIVFSGLFSAIVYLAPGNDLRADRYVGSHNLLLSIFRGLDSFKIYALEWLQFGVILGIIFFSNLKGLLVNKTDFFLRQNIWIVSAWGILLIAFCFILGFYLQGWSLPLRAINSIFLVFLLLFLYFVLYLKYNFGDRIPPLPKAYSYCIMLLLLINLGIKNNIKIAYSDLLKGKAYRYNKELNHRYGLVKNCEADTCYVPKLKNKPPTIYFDDIAEYENDWRSSHYGSFFGKKDILIRNFKE